MVPGETDEQRQQKAETLAEKRGEEKAEIKAHLRDHDKHLAAINGSIDRMGSSLQGLDDRVDELKVEIATMKTKLGFYAAIGSIVGAGAVTLVVAVATRAAGA